MPLTMCPLKEFLIESKLNGFFLGSAVTFGLGSLHSRCDVPPVVFCG